MNIQLYVHSVCPSVRCCLWPCLSECQRLLIGRLMDWADPVACCMQPFVADRPTAQTLAVCGATNQTQGILLFPAHTKMHAISHKEDRNAVEHNAKSVTKLGDATSDPAQTHSVFSLSLFLSRIFSYLDVVTLCRCAQVSKVSTLFCPPPKRPLQTNTCCF